MTLEEYTKSQEERAREEEKRAKLAQMERDKRLRAKGRKQDGKLDKSSKKSIESMDMTQSDWEHLLADKLRKRHKASVKKVFDDADEDDSGELDFFEFFHAMERLDVGKIPRHYAKNMFESIDVDGNGTITVQELLNRCLQPKGVKITPEQKQKLATLQWQDPKLLFERWDKDGSGALSGLELRDGLMLYGLPPDLADTIAFSLDKDGDGKIDSEEWQAEFYNSPLVMKKQPANEDFRDLHHNQLGCTIYQAEMRGITIFQLQDVFAHVERRCSKEGWTNYLELRLSTDLVSLYDVSRYVIRPATYKRQISYVELIATGTQKPKWFVSHWWGEPIKDFLTCLDTHCTDRVLSRPHAAYWICAYASNWWNRAEVDSYDPSKALFTRVMGLVDGTIAVVDKDATFFKRTWCAFEAFAAFTSDREGYFYDVYTMPDTPEARQKKEAIGLTDGQTLNDGRGEIGSQRKKLREQKFPIEVAQAMLRVTIQKAASSVAVDRVHILNFILGEEDLNTQDRLELREKHGHPEYDRFNNTVRAKLATNNLAFAIQKRIDGPFLEAIKNGVTKNLVGNFDGQDAFDLHASTRLAECLPNELEQVQLRLNGFGNAFLVNCNYEKLRNVTSLILPSNRISEEGVTKLCAAFLEGKLESLETLDLSYNLIMDKPMLRLFEATHKRVALKHINVEENPAMGYLAEAVRQKMINSAAREFQQHLIGKSGSLANIAQEKATD